MLAPALITLAQQAPVNWAAVAVAVEVAIAAIGVVVGLLVEANRRALKAAARASVAERQELATRMTTMVESIDALCERMDRAEKRHTEFELKTSTRLTRIETKVGVQA